MLSRRMLRLLVPSVLVSAASIYEGHIISGLSALIFVLAVSEFGKRISSPEVVAASEVVLSVIVLVASPSDLSTLSWALTLGCLPPGRL